MPSAIPADLTPARRRPRIPRRRLVLGGTILALVLAAATAVLWSINFDLSKITAFNWSAISEAIGRFNPVVAIALMAVLPLGGFSIAIVYLVVGARFGPVVGFPVVVGLTAFHLLVSYWIARGFLRGLLERLLSRRGHHLPHLLPGEHSSVCVLVALVPGLPYFARNYLLALTDVRLGTYFWVCLPVHVARSYITILLGDWTSDPDGSQLIVFGAIYAIKLGVCAIIIWHLRRHRHPRARQRQTAS